MAKKRTVIPFFGKINQRLEEEGNMFLRMRQPEAAQKCFSTSLGIIKLRRSKHERRMALGKEITRN